MSIRFREAAASLRQYGQHIPEYRRLSILDKYWREDNRTRNYLQKRRSMHKAIRDLSENGEIAVVWSGMDCDCVQYSGSVSIIDADWRSVQEHIDNQYEWAEGPLYYSFEKPSVAEKIEYESRDLALEAFEDGHPHVIYY